MNEVYIIGYRLTTTNGKLMKAPTFGNFCKKCYTSSDNIMVYGKGLMICSLCDYIFTFEDLKSEIDEFWKKEDAK